MGVRADEGISLANWGNDGCGEYERDGIFLGRMVKLVVDGYARGFANVDR
jgi:hypothetical protein